MIEVDLIQPAGAVEGLQRKSGSHHRLETLAQLVQSPATGREIANLDKAVLVLESDDGGISAKRAPVVHG